MIKTYPVHSQAGLGEVSKMVSKLWEQVDKEQKQVLFLIDSKHRFNSEAEKLQWDCIRCPYGRHRDTVISSHP